jgi:hypothetical protein
VLKSYTLHNMGLNLTNDLAGVAVTEPSTVYESR